MISVNIDAEVKQEFKLLSKELKSVGVKLLAALYVMALNLKKAIVEYVDSLNDFRWSNIQQWGLVQVLMKRAYKFFGLEDAEKREEVKRKIKRGVKRTFKKVFKLFLFPLVLVFYVVSAIFEKKDEKM